MVLYRLEFNVFGAIIVSRKCTEGVAIQAKRHRLSSSISLLLSSFEHTCIHLQGHVIVLQIAFIVYIGLCKCTNFLWISCSWTGHRLKLHRNRLYKRATYTSTHTNKNTKSKMKRKIATTMITHSCVEKTLKMGFTFEEMANQISNEWTFLHLPIVTLTL